MSNILKPGDLVSTNTVLYYGNTTIDKLKPDRIAIVLNVHEDTKIFYYDLPKIDVLIFETQEVIKNISSRWFQKIT